MIETTLLGRADEVIEKRSGLLRCMSPLLAQSGHRLVRCTCPLSGVKRTTGGQTVSVLLIKRRLAALDLALDSGKHCATSR